MQNIVFQAFLFYSILFYPITLGGRRGTTDEFATIPFHPDLFSAALVALAKSIPVHSLILSSHLFFCLPLFLFPFTVPCRIVFAKPEDLETWPNHLSFHLSFQAFSLSYYTTLVPNAGTNHVYLICLFIRYNSCLLGKVKYCIVIKRIAFISYK